MYGYDKKETFVTRWSGTIGLAFLIIIFFVVCYYIDLWATAYKYNFLTKHTSLGSAAIRRLEESTMDENGTDDIYGVLYKEEDNK